MVKEYKLGQMELDMKATGKIIKHMEKENFGMLMEIFFRENGKMIKPMVKELIFM